MEGIFEDLSRSQTLKDRAYTIIRRQIITGKLSPGSRLPEEELSKQMNISRAPIREALNMLEREGFATIIPRKGAIVSTITMKNVKDIWEMRRILEPYAARASVDLIPQSKIDEMRDMIQNVRDNSDNFEMYMLCDLRFHEMFYKHLDNEYLKDNIAATDGHSLRVRYFAESNQCLQKEAVDQVVAEHTGILDLFEQRNRTLIYDAVLNHIINSQERSEAAVSSIIEAEEESV